MWKITIKRQKKVKTAKSRINSPKDYLDMKPKERTLRVIFHMEVGHFYR